MPSVRASVRYSKRFQKELERAPLKVLKAFRKRRELFLLDPSHPQLHDHALAGNYVGYRSINVSGDWRALYTKESLDADNIITFKALGTHSQLYR